MMNKLALVAISLFVVVEILFGDYIIMGMPFWLLGLMLFSFTWIIIIYFKEKVEIKDGY